MSGTEVSVTLDDSVLVVRLVNERSRNSLTAELRSQLAAAVTNAASDNAVRAIYITGQGAAFCSGGDLHMLKKEHDPWAVHQRFQLLRSWFLSFLQIPKPVVVGVNGYAVGGGMGLALAGDLIYAADDAQFISGFFRLGVIPDVGTMYTLPRLIGMARTKRFLFGDEPMTAREAYECGLVAKVVPRAELDEACLKKAKQLAAGPAEIIGLSKSLLARTFETGMNEMFMLESLGQGLAMSSGEFEEGLSAMLEKRPAKFAEVSQPKPADGTGSKPKS